MATEKKAARKRAQTIASRQEKLKMKVIEELDKIPVVEVAVKKAGASSSTYYRWLQDDREFAKAAGLALENGVARINDIAESKVITGIYNDKADYVKFWLRARKIEYAPHHSHIRQWEPDPLEDENGGLTEERKKEIYDALKAWNSPDPEPYTVND